MLIRFGSNTERESEYVWKREDHKEHLKLRMETYKTIQITRHNINDEQEIYNYYR